MAGPLGAVRFAHIPIRNDLKGIKQELGTAASLGVGNLPLIAERFAFLENFLNIHEKAEEEVWFPAIDAKVPGASQAYEQAHRTMDGLRGQLQEALASNNAERGYAVASEITDKMNAHLDQEEQELIPLCDQHFSPEEQGALAGQMSARTPQDQMPKLLPWMFRLQGQGEREGFLRLLMNVMPPPAFQGVKAMAQGAIGAPEWQELTARIPELRAQ